MLRKAQRLPQTVFTGRPKHRINFDFGSVSLFDGPKRAAVIISKKVARSAVDRNRIRRRMIHALRDLKHTSGLAVYPSKAALTAKFADIQGALARAVESR